MTPKAIAIPTETQAAKKGPTQAEKREMLLAKLGIIRNSAGFAGWAGSDLVNEVDAVIATCKPKSAAGRTPEERAAIKAEKSFGKRLEKQVSWLKLDGVRNGGFAVERGTDKMVVVLTDPRIDIAGERVTMEVKSGLDGEVMTVDAMLYRPCYDKVHELKQQKQTDENDKHIAARATKGSKVSKVSRKANS